MVDATCRPIRVRVNDGCRTLTPSCNFLNRKKEKPAGLLRSGFRVVIRSQILLPVGEHSHVLTAAVLKDHALPGLVIDLVSLSARLRQIFRRGLMAVAKQD